MNGKVFTLIVALVAAGWQAGAKTDKGPDRVPESMVQHKTLAEKVQYAPKAMSFIENKGQVRDQLGNTRPDIDFKIEGGKVNVFIGKGSMHYQFSQAPLHKEEGKLNMYRMDVTLVGADKNAIMLAEEKQPFFEQHFTGQHTDRAYTYKKVTYQNVYPGIDWVFYFNGSGKLEHDFVVHPGGKVSDICLEYGGATSISLNKDGSLTATTPMGTITEAAPHSYEQNGKVIASAFVLKDNVLRFQTAAHTGTLVIDPTLDWGTYYGTPFDYNDNLDQTVIRTDPKGNIYVAGITTGSMTNIATTGSYQSAPNVNNAWELNQFLVKLNSSGQRLWATYYGKNVYPIGTGLACDRRGNVYLSGGTLEDAAIATPAAHQSAFGTGTACDAYLVKFDSTGARQWSTYYGGSGQDVGFALHCDTAGNVFMVGRTKSGTNIASAGSHKASLVGNEAFFLVKFNSAGLRQWGTYYGENAPAETGWTPDMTIAGDQEGNVFFTGVVGIYPSTTLLPADMVTPGSHQPVHGGEHDVLLVKFNGSGIRQWATWYGGDKEDLITREGLACDQWGNAYLLGITGSATGIATAGSHQSTFGGGTSPWSPMHVPGDAFLVKFNGAGVRKWATYYGGTEGENSYGYGGVGCDIFGNVIIGGETQSNTSIATPGSYQPTLLSYDNGYLVKFDSTGLRKWGTYFGSIAEGRIETVASNDSGQIFIAGFFNDYTNLSTPGAHQNIPTPLYIAKFDDCSDIVSAADTIHGKVLICAGATGQYSVTPVPGAGSYTWLLPAGWNGSSNSATIDVTAANNSGTIRVAANFSCGAGDTIALQVTVQPLPVPVITAAGNVLSTGTYTSYQWKLNGTDIAGATSNSHTATVTGTYTVTVTNNNGCKGTSVAYAHTLTSLQEHPLKDLVKIFPNPATAYITVMALLPLKLDICSMEGKVIYSRNLVPGSNTLGIGGLANGLYLLRIADKEGRVWNTEKLVKQ